MGNESDEFPVIKQVDLTVPKTDDPNMPVFTFRVWVLGVVSCTFLSVVNQFFWYRTQPLAISSISAMIAVVPIGHFMARVLPEKVYFEGTKWAFTMNSGPFNVKEHVLITIFANSGAGSVYATHVLTAVKLLYKRKLGFFPAFVLMVTTQVLGYGWAGIFRKFLVEPASMWWPVSLVKVSLFRALHEKEKRPKGGMTRTQSFLICLICGFVYYLFPGYFFQLLTTVSWVCWLAPKSVFIQQLGSGSQALGIGSFGFDWATICAYLDTPLASPWFATVNVAVGFIFAMYVMTPLSYWWANAYHAKKFPIYSDGLFKIDGSKYNISSITTPGFQLDKSAYAEAGPLYLSTFFAMTYGLGFAALPATIVHVLLFNGSDLWKQTKMAFKENTKVDIHTRLMMAYEQIPMWWFHVILVVNIVLIIFVCEYYKYELQLRWWGVLLACAIAITYTLPIGIIYATTNQQPGLNIITEYIIGYLYPGYPVANMSFKVYGYISMAQALTFLNDFKLGHYMKIPPKAMFKAQVAGTMISVLVYLGTAWWMMANIPNLCDRSVLPLNSQWRCPGDTVFYDASVIWGLIGPQRIFGNLGHYSKVNLFFVAGAICPLLVWLAHKAFPDQHWIRLVNMPVILGATALMPPASSANYISWLVLAFLSGFVVFRYRPKLWERYNYILSGGLDAGTAFVTILLFACLQFKEIGVDWWGNRGEGCPLAHCPTAKGIIVDGCPVFN
ncbi:hypothetical protein ACET3Z_014930 [Daucus carota]